MTSGPDKPQLVSQRRCSTELGTRAVFEGSGWPGAQNEVLTLTCKRAQSAKSLGVSDSDFVAEMHHPDDVHGAILEIVNKHLILAFGEKSSCAHVGRGKSVSSPCWISSYVSQPPNSPTLVMNNAQSSTFHTITSATRRRKQTHQDFLPHLCH